MIMEKIIDAQSLLQFCLIVAFFLSAGANFIQWRNREKPQLREIIPQPIGVIIRDGPVTQSACDKEMSNNRKEHEALFSKIGGAELGANQRMDALRLEIKSDFKGVHDRINDVLAAVNRLEGAQE